MSSAAKWMSRFRNGEVALTLQYGGLGDLDKGGLVE